MSEPAVVSQQGVVSLPLSVEQLISKIYTEQNKLPPDDGARRSLASLGEDAALDVLRTIASDKIKYSFSGYINYLVKKRNNNGSPLKRVCFSPSSPQQNRSPVTVTTVRLLNLPQGLGTDYVVKQSPVADQQPRGSPMSSISHAMRHRASIPQYVALGELEFRKAFLILSYIGENSLEEVITADEIRGMRDLQMARFESEVWEKLGRKNISQEDRRMSLKWDSGKTHMYHCHISTKGNCTFKGPYLNQTRTHLQRELGDDNILLVKFDEELGGHRSSNSWNDSYSKYNEIAREVFKDGGKEEKKKDPSTSPVKCYFVRMESSASIDMGYQYILSGKTVHEARYMFMHVRTVSSVANYMSRLSLILSKTMKLEVDFSRINIERIEDEPCRDKDGNVVYKDGEALIHTDGTGFISEDLALKCPTYVYKEKCTNDDSTETLGIDVCHGGCVGGGGWCGQQMQNAVFRSIDRKELEANFSDVARTESHYGEPPLLMQVRLFYNGTAVKGTLLLNKKLPPQTIQIRPSMIKVKADRDLSDGQTFNSLEGSTPDSLHLLFSSQAVSFNYGGMDYDFTSARMILSGISLDEPYLQHRLSILMKEEKKSLQAGKLPVTESYYLMGTVDPTGILKSNEVCIILKDGQVSWEKVLVYRNPGLHFGDIHVLKATYVKELEDFVGTSKYAIFFPCNGPRSLADEIAGGDFDGDMYFVSRNPELLKHFKESERWMSTSKNLSANKRLIDFSLEELESELFKLFLNTRFCPSNAKSLAADCWQAVMDRFLTLGDESAEEKAAMKENMLRLINIYYDALDAPKKSGIKVEVPEDLKVEKFPCYMRRDESVSFESTSVLGTIYNTVKSYEAVDRSVTEIWKLPCFDDGVPEACMTKWKGYYDQYRWEMKEAIDKCTVEREEAAELVIEKYKQILYGAAEFEQSTRTPEEIYNEALAIYNITYDLAASRRQVSYCSFAWRVAGSALRKFYARRQGDRSMLCSASVLREICG
ncbi:putative RNA-dependent RNA polymerase 3 [Citrus sinensis]|uniref:RNA-dependent RNA polymerase 3 n=1 Tax=Citrus sinensis TaxID=2711 RepID=A0ACB8NS67_CITSI|nr:putative RNA-dependent RNA polymerase 3 [Citrus sinensis]